MVTPLIAGILGTLSGGLLGSATAGGGSLVDLSKKEQTTRTTTISPVTTRTTTYAPFTQTTISNAYTAIIGSPQATLSKKESVDVSGKPQIDVSPEISPAFKQAVMPSLAGGGGGGFADNIPALLIVGGLGIGGYLFLKKKK